jgi:anti-sigma factor RsiW
MSCDVVTEELLAYHLGAVEPALRDTVDAHLLDCRSCLRSYLDIKRQVEDAALPEGRPSPAARERLRSEVADRFVPASLPWIPGRRALLWGAAAAALLAVLSLAVNQLSHRTHVRTNNAANNPELIDEEQANSALKFL